ncbi:hypothetical protein M409DRAFT_62509 [Zasmidium cellare ATCC 36951]|uniref:Deacetylase sirtuin-type domain-containing protein n=1 Tax=Zasmidium cellare ATCC 36951 TaxID=1080233 RepID=A0A6A6D0D1_ZASCE|nr:uncharacterized protein M409DRAFT_62509 [Zasmidium cellare ATCC 36951]KAF2172831.1 hypothetical protein M409DRAFT_62509 [Zasmidium cellare ATCC 36951]
MFEDLKSFHEYLSKSKRVLALCGAGLSASSGLPTFRGAGGLWRNHDATQLATPGAFEEDPALVWRFYSYRRHMSLNAKPNAAHYAFAEYARRTPGFMNLSQNVDGLYQMADHPKEQLKLLHNTLFEVRCVNRACGYVEENFTDPIVPSLAIPMDKSDPTTTEALAAAGKANRKELDISNAAVPISNIPVKDLPQCPKCKERMLRPNVVWFGENLPMDTIDEIEEYLHEPEDVDLIIVVGTSAKVYPAAGYTTKARMKGARVCVVNMDANDAPAGGWNKGDWFFQGDAAEIIPRLLEPVTCVEIPRSSKV